MNRWVVAALGTAVIALVVTMSVYLRGTDVVDHDKQSWPKAYAYTTCEEWNGKMTDDQRFDAAKYLLGEKLSDNGATSGPDYGAVQQFESALDDECQAKPLWVLSQAADGLDYG